MGDMFDVFSQNPTDMPGQGLAQADNFNPGEAADQYRWLNEIFYGNQDYQLQQEAKYSPQWIDRGLANTGQAQTGLLNLYAQALNSLTGAQTGADAATRSGDLAFLNANGAGGKSAWDAINPGQAQLLSQLTESANTGLAAGARLRPDDARAIARGVQSDYAGRGFGGNLPAAQLEQAMQLYGSGEALRSARQNAAMNAANANNSNYANLYALLMQKSPTTGQAMQFLQGAQQTGQNPNAPMQNANSGSFNLLGNIYNQNQANNRTTAGLETQVGMDQANKWNDWFQVGAGAIACWAAREVFGESDPKWLQFRHWMLFAAPDKLRKWYLANGSAWAERLRHNPVAKAVVRRWMERRITV